MGSDDRNAPSPPPVSQAEAEELRSARKAEAFARGQAQVLASIASDAPLEATLALLTRIIECRHEGLVCTVLRLDPAGRRVEAAVGPSLPGAFLRSMEGQAIGPGAGSCGASMHENRLVVTEDILGDPLWDAFRAAAVPYGLRACWSMPIRSRKGAVLGAFGMYYREVRSPGGEDLSDMDVAVDLAAIAIERSRYEAALVASEERFRSLVENISEALFTTDREGNLTYASRALETLTGYPVSEIVGKNLLALALPQDIPLFAESFARRLDGSLETMEHRIRTRSSEMRWVRTSSRPIVSGGRPAGIRGVMADITARKQVEEQLRQSQKMEAIGRLAGGVAHDFNNLLTAINGYSSLALSLVEPDRPLHAYLSEILKSGERAAALTRQLLAYSRKQILAPRVLDLNEIVADMQGMFRRLIGEDVELIASLASDLSPVRVDRGQVEQILLNLVVNARDAMPRGGRIVVETANAGPGEPPRAGIAGGRVPPPGRYVRLAVRDTGVGMGPEVKSRLFEPFFTTKPVGKGTGLGLPVVYGIVEQSEGYLAVDSEPGKGATFAIYFPVAAPGPGDAAGPVDPPAAEAAPGGGYVLLVEDEGGVRRYVRRVLETLGYRVASARNGLEALSLLEEAGSRINLVIADVVMPEMGGDELAAELRRLHPDLPVLFMSGYHEPGEGGVPGEGRAHFLQKPFGPDALAAKVRQALDAAAAAPPSRGRR